MAAIFPSSFSITDDDNISIPTSAGGSTNMAEGCKAAGVNNAIRSLAAVTASMWGGAHSATGTTRPDSVQADSFWIGNTGTATEHHIYWYDGTQDFQIADYDVTNNTFTWTVDTTGNAATATALVSGTNLASSGVNVFTSTAQTVTAGSSTTIAHGLGAAPTWITVIYEANDTDVGYVAGDQIHYGPTQLTESNIAQIYGHSCWADATNIYIRVATNGLAAISKSTFGWTGLDETKWDIYVRAMR